MITSFAGSLEIISDISKVRPMFSIVSMVIAEPNAVEIDTLIGYEKSRFKVSSL